MRLQAFQVRRDSFPDVLDGFFSGLTLRDASGQGRHLCNVHAIFILLDQDTIFRTLAPFLDGRCALYPCLGSQPRSQR
jgi:hypothetical protein